MSDCPKIGQEVEIKYKIYTNDEKVIDSTENHPNFRVLLGNNKIINDIENTILQMKKGEKREKIKISEENSDNILNLLNFNNKEENKTENNKEIFFDIELIDFYDKIKSVYEMGTEEKFEMAKKIKLDGVNNFKNNEFEKAIKNFEEADKYIEKINEKDITEEMKKLKISLLLNICNCNNKIKNYPKTIEIANKIEKIDSKNVKIFYYRGNANAFLDEFEKAYEDYNKLVENIENKNDPGVIALKKLIDDRKKTKESKQKSRLKNLFKQDLYSDTK